MLLLYQSSNKASALFYSLYISLETASKGQIQGVEKGDILAQVEFVYQIFGVAA